MKARSIARRPPLVPEIQGNFVRGFVSAGLLAGFQSAGEKRRTPANARRILRLALQGGAALSAGGATVDALRQDSPVRALAAIAAGVVALAVIERLLHDEILKIT